MTEDVNELLAANGELVWRQRGALALAYDLFAGSRPVGSMRRSALWHTAQAHVGPHLLQLAMKGFLRARPICYDARSGAELAQFRGKAFGRDGAFVTSNGRAYGLRYANAWSSSTATCDLDGAVVFEQEYSVGFGVEGRVRVERDAVGDANVPYLVALCWFTALMRRG